MCMVRERHRIKFRKHGSPRDVIYEGFTTSIVIGSPYMVSKGRLYKVNLLRFIRRHVFVTVYKETCFLLQFIRRRVSCYSL